MALLRLASNSPRRRQLLSLTGIPFTVHPVDIDECFHTGESPAEYVLRLARTKARAALETVQTGEILLAADTTVADGQRILGKPADAADARDMLRSLRGRDHAVYTAIGVADPGTGRLVSELCATQVWMRNTTDAEIEDYIASGDPFDKAGAYAIQNQAFHPVERIEGCYACVMGLPVCHVVRVLEGFGIRPTYDVAATCPEHLALNSPCPVTRIILGNRPGMEKIQSNQD
ncbi:MAG: septum formation protein Maf [Anaerolineaceae bacterium]|nr:septum formation protein Maf [Anaerolineaceae bacterium]